jgi:hypothetical protein
MLFESLRTVFFSVQSRQDSLISNELASLVVSSRDPTYSIFHSLGKILHGKATSVVDRQTVGDDDDDYSLQNPSLKDEFHDVEWIIQHSDLPPPLFMDFLHANYMDYITPNSNDQKSTFRFKQKQQNTNAPKLQKQLSTPSMPSSKLNFSKSNNDVIDLDDDIDWDLVSESNTTKAQPSNAIDPLDELVELSDMMSQADILAQASTAQYGNVS